MTSYDFCGNEKVAKTTQKYKLTEAWRTILRYFCTKDYQCQNKNHKGKLKLEQYQAG